jgi:hypothetical protein
MYEQWEQKLNNEEKCEKYESKVKEIVNKLNKE